MKQPSGPRTKKSENRRSMSSPRGPTPLNSPCTATFSASVMTAVIECLLSRICRSRK